MTEAGSPLRGTGGTPTLTSVLLVEDDADLRENLGRWLSCSGYHVRPAADALAGLEIAKREPIDVVVSDVRLHGPSGLDLLALIRSWDPEVPVIMLSGCATLDDAVAALRGRAFDFLRKPLDDLYQLNLTIERAVASRQRPAVAAPPARGDVAALGDRELMLLKLLAEGLENGEIARRLGLSAKTVRNNLSSLFQRLGVANRTQAAAVYLRRVQGA